MIGPLLASLALFSRRLDGPAAPRLRAQPRPSARRGALRRPFRKAPGRPPTRRLEDLRRRRGLRDAPRGGAGGGLAFPGPTPGAFSTPAYGGDAFILKLNPSGTGLVYSSLFGGEAAEGGNAIAVNAAGEAAVVGTVAFASPGGRGFPLVNAFQTTFGGGHNDAFVIKLNAAGSAPAFSTYLGGGQAYINNNDDWGTGVGYDAAGNVYAGGMTYSPDFPVTPGAFDATWNGPDGFVTKFTPTGGLVYSTFVGGVGREEQFGLAVSPGGRRPPRSRRSRWATP